MQTICHMRDESCIIWILSWGCFHRLSPEVYLNEIGFTKSNMNTSLINTALAESEFCG